MQKKLIDQVEFREGQRQVAHPNKIYHVYFKDEKIAQVYLVYKSNNNYKYYDYDTTSFFKYLSLTHEEFVALVKEYFKRQKIHVTYIMPPRRTMTFLK